MSTANETSIEYSSTGRAGDIVRAIRSNQTWAVQSRAEMLVALADFEYFGLAESFGETSTAGWLARELKLAPSTAFEYVSVARQLPDFPLLTKAFRGGEFSYSTVRFLLKHLSPDNEAQLVDLAQRLCFTELRQALAGLGSSQEAEREPDYHHRVRHADNGDVIVSARLNAMDGAAYLAALKIAQLSNYGLEDVGEHDLADEEKVEELLAEKQAQPEVDPAEELEPVPQKRESFSDALKRSFSRFGPPVKDDMHSALLSMIAMVRSRPVSDLRAPGAHVNIMMTTNGRTWLPGNLAAPSETVKNYLDNAMLRLHLLDNDGVTLHLGRTARFVNNGQLRALLAVWNYQCAMPGCSHTRFLEVHHIKEWSDGGSTNLENLIPLCSSCHSRVSNRQAHITTNGRDIEFRFRGGRRFVSRARQLPEETDAFTGPLVPQSAIDRSAPDHERGGDFDD